MNRSSAKIYDKTLTGHLPIKELKKVRKPKHELSIFKIISKADLRTFIFDKNTYKEKVLKDYISKEEYDSVINQASNVMYKSWLKKKKRDSYSIPLFSRNLIAYSIIMILLYLVTLYVAPLVKSKLIIILATSFIATAFVFLIFVIFLNIKRKLENFETLEEILEAEFKIFLNKVNIKFTNKVEFKFFCQEMIIECNIISRLKEENEEVKEIDQSSVTKIKEETKILENDISNSLINKINNQEIELVDMRKMKEN